MDYSCYKCGRNIEEGKPFCSDCGAPQIRVVIPEAAPESIPTSGETLLPQHADGATVLPTDGPDALRGPWSSSLKQCALAAAAAVALSFLGLNPFVAAFGAGWLGVALSRHSLPGSSIRPSFGAKIGALSGLLLFCMSTIFEALAVLLLHKEAQLRAEMLEKIQQAASRYPGPEVQPFLNFVRTPEGFAFMMIGSVIFALVAFVILGGLGGAASAAILGRRDRL
jgi:hypothetical protein